VSDEQIPGQLTLEEVIELVEQEQGDDEAAA